MNNRDELRRMAREILLSELKKRREESDTLSTDKSTIKDPLRNLKAISKYYGQSNRLD